MQYINAALFEDEQTKICGVDTVREICDFLDAPMISMDESCVCLERKLRLSGRVREISVEIEELEACEVVNTPEDICLNSWHAGYKITISNTTDYDQDDGFDKYYPVF